MAAILILCVLCAYGEAHETEITFHWERFCIKHIVLYVKRNFKAKLTWALEVGASLILALRTYQVNNRLWLQAVPCLRAVLEF